MLAACTAAPRTAHADGDPGMGWALAAGHVGFGLGALGAYGLVRAHQASVDPNAPDDTSMALVAVGSGVLVLGATAGAALGADALARGNGWNRTAGWASMGGVIGAMAGAGGGIGLAFAVDEHPSTGALIGSAVGGAALGGATGALLFGTWSHSDDNMAGEFVGTYVGAYGGALLGALTSLAAVPGSVKEHVARRTGFLGVGAGLGAFAGMIIGHVVQRPRPIDSTNVSLGASAEPAAIHLSGRF